MKIGEIFELNKLEQEIVALTAKYRQINKENSGISGKGTVANDHKHLHRNLIGFGAEFIFCKNFNIHSDYSINNNSKIKNTDNYDATLSGITIDVKTTEKNLPLMTPVWSKSDVHGFAFFGCKYPKYKFFGFATNKMLFKEKNIRQTKVPAFVLEKRDLIGFSEFIFENRFHIKNNIEHLKILK